MNDAVWKFRSFEEPSLKYGGLGAVASIQGGWTLLRDERFADLIAGGFLRPGEEVRGAGGDVTAVVTADYGLAVGGIRYESPDSAALAATEGAVSDGWRFWSTETETERGSDLGRTACHSHWCDIVLRCGWLSSDRCRPPS